MFTGLIQTIGIVSKIERSASEACFTVRSRLPLSALSTGASVCHNGVCLTITQSFPLDEKSGGGALHVVQAVEETLMRTNLGDMQEGSVLNLEPSLRIGDALGGHLVFGHVDCLGTISQIKQVGEGWRIKIAAPDSFMPYIAQKGSVAVDGISLTIASCDAKSFDIALIPHSYQATTMQYKAEGDTVNLEADMLARYVERQLTFAQGKL